MLVNLSEYSVGCRIMDGYFLINITYDSNWNVIPPENDKIEFAQKNGVSYYMALINEVPFNEVFSSIKETIDYNIDLQKKVKLFKTKVDELQEIFAKEDLETLKTITFEYSTKKKEKRKYIKKKDIADKKTKNNNTDESLIEQNMDTEKNNAAEKEKTTINVLDNENDDVIYEEYQGEVESAIENKVDYMEQLKAVSNS